MYIACINDHQDSVFKKIILLRNKIKFFEAWVCFTLCQAAVSIIFSFLCPLKVKSQLPKARLQTYDMNQ